MNIVAELNFGQAALPILGLVAAATFALICAAVSFIKSMTKEPSRSSRSGMATGAVAMVVGGLVLMICRAPHGIASYPFIPSAAAVLLGAVGIAFSVLRSRG